ncbi:hypothetical protein [Streptomyces sp. TE5632]
MRLRVEYMDGDTYRLRNWGDATATNVVNTEPCPAVVDWAAPLTLQPGEAHPFMIAGDYDNPAPTQLAVAWDGQEDPVILPVP